MISILKRKKKTIFTILLLIIILNLLPVKAETSKKQVNIYFFHSNNCNHCKSEQKLLNDLEAKYDNIKIYYYEVHDKRNNENRLKVKELYDIKTNGVPLTIIGDTPYIGYIEEKDTIKFIKTIEYYSKYGYEDRVGKFLEITNTSSNEIEPPAQTLTEFLKLISIIIILVILIKIKDNNQTLKLLFNYFLISILLNTLNTINNSIYTIVISSIIVILFILNIIKHIKTKEKYYLYNLLTMVIAILTSYLENYNYLTYSKIFKELIRLNNITGLSKISFYGNYLFIMISINILLIIIIYNIKTKAVARKPAIKD